MKKLRGLFAKKEDIKPKLLSFREFCQYVYEPAKHMKKLGSKMEKEDKLTSHRP